jgi:hypothetical protein
MAVGKLTPLGDPAPNAPKWFAAVEMIRLAADTDWLHKATKEISKYWRNKRASSVFCTLVAHGTAASRLTTELGNQEASEPCGHHLLVFHNH